MPRERRSAIEIGLRMQYRTKQVEFEVWKITGHPFLVEAVEWDPRCSHVGGAERVQCLREPKSSKAFAFVSLHSAHHLRNKVPVLRAVAE